MAHQYTLWGFRVPDEPQPITLATGVISHILSEQETWQAAGWTCDYYLAGAEPARIRQQARNAAPPLVALWCSENPGDPLTQVAVGTLAEVRPGLLAARRAGWTAELREVDNVAQPAL